MEFLRKLAYVLVLIGALNWGFIGIADFDLVAFIFGTMSVLSRIVYTLVGLSGIWLIIDSFLDHKA